MIKSMTGYGSAKSVIDGMEISIELKSVNNRFLDCSVRMPRSLLFAEDRVKAVVQEHISRGKVDVFVNVGTSQDEGVIVKVNELLLRSYVEAVRHIAEEYQLPQELSAISLSRYPDVLSVEKKELQQEPMAEAIRELAERALQDFDSMRLREGQKLSEDVLMRLEKIESLVSEVERQAPNTLMEYRKRLEDKLHEVLGASGIEESRILTEAAIFADRIAVDEETVRLRSHISQLRAMIDGGSPIGRKIDFLVQEFNREANTIGSKCQNKEIAYCVVEIKAEIEKIREQIQNIE